MNEKVTILSPPYPEGYEPDLIDPPNYCEYRYAIGKCGTKPLVAICMNPSAATEESSDRTINRVIKISDYLSMDGWIVFNTYPERATDARNIGNYREDWSKENICVIQNFLVANKITEVWGAWGNDRNNASLRKGKHELLSMLNRIDVKVFYFGTLTMKQNPRHPLQRREKVNFTNENKHFL